MMNTGHHISSVKLNMKLLTELVHNLVLVLGKKTRDESYRTCGKIGLDEIVRNSCNTKPKIGC